MWGNRLGWCISAALVLVVGWLMVELARVPGVGPTSGAFPWMFEPVQLPTAPGAAVSVMTQARDAGETYAKAIEAYLADQRTYDEFYAPSGRAPAPPTDPAGLRLHNLQGARRRVEEGSKLPAVQLVLDGAPCTQMMLFIRRPEAVVGYKATQELDGIARLGDIIGQIATAHLLLDHYDDAQTYYEAQFSLGAKLFQERLTHRELIVGVGQMRAAANGLARGATRQGNSARAEQLQTFSKQTGDYYQRKVQPMWRAIGAVDQTLINQHGGDVFALARNTQADRMWRVEAMLKVGRTKYNAASKGEQSAAVREPRLWRSDPDPAVAAAAKAADELTIEDYRMINVLN